jgi:hypothetical protein
MKLMVLKNLVKKSGTVMWGPTMISQRVREDMLIK